METARIYEIVFAVCHPDDEALWVGGLLCELAKFPFIRCHVVCLSGKDVNSSRMQEFEAAKKIAGYSSGVILGFPLRPATQPLPATSATLKQGLEQLGLEPSRIDLLVTHSPYGDEHKHPHHVQTYRELKAWCDATAVPFGFFSGIQLPWIAHTPLLTEMRRTGGLQLLNHSQCDQRWLGSPRIVAITDVFSDRPKHYLQFLTDWNAKAKMLASYRSIDLAMHEAGYAMFTNPCEAIYLADDRALAPLQAVIDVMSVPGAQALMRKLEPMTRNLPLRAMRKLGRMLRLERAN